MSQRLANIGRAGGLVVANGETTLPFPPAVFGMVPDGWSGAGGIGVVPQLAVHWYAEASVTLTDAEIYAGTSFPSPDIVDADLVPADVDIGADTLAKVAHGYLFADGPFRWRTRATLSLGPLTAGHHLNTIVEAVQVGADGNAVTVRAIGDSAPAAGVSIVETGSAVVIHYESGVSTVADVETKIGTDATLIRVKTPGTGATLLTAPGDNFAATALAGGNDHPTNVPGGSAADVDYWVKPTDADHFQIFDDLESAIDSGDPVDLATIGTGTFVLAPTDDAARFHWSLVLTIASVVLDAQLARTVLIDHDPNVVAYAAAAALGSPVATTVRLDPRVEIGG